MAQRQRPSGASPLEDFADDGPDLSPSFLIDSADFSQLSIDDDVVLGASRRLRTAVDKILVLLQKIASLQNMDTDSVKSGSSEQSTLTSDNPKPNVEVTTNTSELEKRIKMLEADLKQAHLQNQSLMKEYAEKHQQLSTLKSRIDNNDILEARNLKESNDKLKSEVEKQNETIAKLIDAYESINALSEAKDLKIEELEARNQKLQSLVHELSAKFNQTTGHDSMVGGDAPKSVEKGRDGSGSPGFEPLTHHKSTPPSFSKNTSRNLSVIDSDVSESDTSDSPGAFDDESTKYRSFQASAATRVKKNQPPRRLQKRSNDRSFNSHRQKKNSSQEESYVDLTDVYKQIIAEKDAENDLLREQMKMAKSMIATAFPDIMAPVEQPDHSENITDIVDFIQQVVDAHVSRGIQEAQSQRMLSETDSGRNSCRRQKQSMGKPSPAESGYGPSSNPGSHRNQYESPGVVSSDPHLSSGGDSYSSDVTSHDTTSFLTMNKLDSNVGKLHLCVDKLIKNNNKLTHELEEERKKRLAAEKSAEGMNATRQLLETRISRLTHEKENLVKETKTKMIEIERLKAQQETVTRQKLEHLNTKVKDQQTLIESEQKRVVDLSRKNTVLEAEAESKQFYEKKTKEYQLQLETAHEIIRVKKMKIKELMDNLKKNSAMYEEQVKRAEELRMAAERQRDEADSKRSLVTKVKKLQHDNRALVYQKKYLWNVLKGMQVTEQATMALLENMQSSFEGKIFFHVYI